MNIWEFGEIVVKIKANVMFKNHLLCLMERLADNRLWSVCVIRFALVNNINHK